MDSRTARRTWRSGTLAGLAVVALAAPAGARAGGAEWTAAEGGPCDDDVSVPVTGRFKELYECVDDRWAVMDAVGEPGPAGRNGTDGRDGPVGRDGTDGQDGADGSAGRDGQDGTQGPEGPQGPPGPDGSQGPEGPQGAQGPPGPGLAMYSGSFAGPVPWDAGGAAPLLPAALEPPSGMWAVTFHVVVVADGAPVDAECTLDVAGAPAPTVLAVRATVPAGARSTLSGNGWLTTSGTDIVNVSCHDAGGVATGTLESGTVDLVPVETVLGPPAG